MIGRRPLRLLSWRRLESYLSISSTSGDYGRAVTSPSALPSSSLVLGLALAGSCWLPITLRRWRPSWPPAARCSAMPGAYTGGRRSRPELTANALRDWCRGNQLHRARLAMAKPVRGGLWRPAVQRAACRGGLQRPAGGSETGGGPRIEYSIGRPQCALGYLTRPPSPRFGPLIPNPIAGGPTTWVRPVQRRPAACLANRSYGAY
jgi:hypothetical protein